MPQIFNKPVLLVFNAGVTPQEVETNVTVPFKVGKIVFNPPFAHVLAADTKDESYLIQSDLNPNGLGVVGAFSGVVGAGVVATATSQPVEYVFKQPAEISGLHKFLIRGFVAAAGGAANPITAKILMNLEFHEAH